MDFMDKPWIYYNCQRKRVHSVVNHKEASTFATIVLVVISNDIMVLLLWDRSHEYVSRMQSWWKLTEKKAVRWLNGLVLCVSIGVDRYHCFSSGLRQCERAANWWASDRFIDGDCVFISSPAVGWRSNTCDSDIVCAVLHPYIRDSRGRRGVSSLG